MKKNNFIKSMLMIACFCLACNIITAQQRPPCGNGKIDTAAINAALQFEKRAPRTLIVNYLVRVWFHVFHNDDGTQGAARRSQIDSEFNSLLASYTGNNLCFLFAGIDSTNSTALNQNFNADSDPNGTALNAYQVPNCLNIFYMRKINGNNTACSPPCGYGGIALGGIPGTFCLVATGNIGPGNTIGHEVGHCLGLYHTFEKVFGFEKIDGSNASTAGDKITDTPADPYCYQGQSCYTTSANGCTYTGTCTDPNSATNFSPPYTNLMAYWWTGSSGVCVANPLATSGQFTRVNSFLNTNTALMNCSSPASVTLSSVSVTSGYYMKSAISSLTTSGTVSITATTNASLGGGTVLLEPGFIATPTGNGLTHIVAKPCN